MGVVHDHLAGPGKLGKRKSHDNPYIQKLYEEYLGKPLGEKSEMLLHTHYFNKSID